MTNLRTVFSIVSLVVSFVIAQTPLNAPADTATKTVTSGNFTFAYKIDGENIVAKLSCPSSGWVAVGFNTRDGMKKAFFITGAVIDGKAVISEDFGTGMVSHKPITALGGRTVVTASDCTVENGIATLTFTMPLSTKDGMHADLAAGKKIHLLFAAGGSNELSKKHKTRKSVIITL